MFTGLTLNGFGFIYCSLANVTNYGVRLLALACGITGIMGAFGILLFFEPRTLPLSRVSTNWVGYGGLVLQTVGLFGSVLYAVYLARRCGSVLPVATHATLVIMGLSLTLTALAGLHALNRGGSQAFDHGPAFASVILLYFAYPFAAAAFNQVRHIVTQGPAPFARAVSTQEQ